MGAHSSASEVSAIQRSIRDVDKFLNYVEHVPENLEAAAANLQEIAGRLLLAADKIANVDKRTMSVVTSDERVRT